MATASVPAAVQDPAGAPALVVEALSFRYGDILALDGVSLSVPAGGRLGLLGPNGSGKSTLLAVIAGLITQTSGTVRVLGAPPGVRSRSRIGVVFQEPGLDLLMRVEETLSLHGRLFGLRGERLHQTVSARLARFGLADRARSLVGTLSGGMRRRLSIARAMLAEPELLLLDEPTVGLDPDSRRQVWEDLRSVSDGGTALVVASQDVGEIERECEAAALMREGRVIRLGTIAELRAGLRRDSVRVELTAIPEGLVAAIGDLPDVGGITVREPIVHATVDDASTFVPRLFAMAPGLIRDIRITASTLEDAYFRIVGTSLHPGDVP